MVGIREIFFPGRRPIQQYAEGKLPWPKLAEDFNRYLAGEKINWSSYPLDRSGYRSFTVSVLAEVSRISYGEVRTYREIACLANSPLAWRAAGQALKANRHPIIVPCHRVIGSGKGIGGFSGPPGWKKMLLELEKVEIEG
ncbi:MAG: methylated-DNA--[protein]-cysteine S-methyltransferase [Bacillota bacterium]|nr:methylated-DNA--[protein]-cysteine S-methyltransferase [Bacillota bacterium]